MHLYLFERTDEIGYDEYDAYVIAAESAQVASKYVAWCAELDSPPTCKTIGEASEGVQEGVIISSFNAG